MFKWDSFLALGLCLPRVLYLEKMGYLPFHQIKEDYREQKGIKMNLESLNYCF